MANLIDPTTNRTYVQEACLGNLREWTTQRRILKAVLFSRRIPHNPTSLKMLVTAVANTIKDRSGGGMSEKDTIVQCLGLMEDPKVLRIIARVTTKLHGVPFKTALEDLREFKVELLEMVKPHLVTLH